MMQAVSVILYLLLAPLAGALLDGVDRKISARMQGRQGPPPDQQDWYCAHNTRSLW